MDYVKDALRYSNDVLGHGFTSVRGIFYETAGEKPLLKTPPMPVTTSAMKSSWVEVVLGNSSPWIRLAGLSGAIAVSMGAYGAHGMKNVTDEQRAVFETANKYHFLHTLALLAVPMTNRPNLVGTLLVAGTAVFSGTCYVHAITGNNEIIKYTPYGGMTLIAAWLAMVL